MIQITGNSVPFYFDAKYGIQALCLPSGLLKLSICVRFDVLQYQHNNIWLPPSLTQLKIYSTDNCWMMDIIWRSIPPTVTDLDIEAIPNDLSVIKRCLPPKLCRLRMDVSDALFESSDDLLID